jgi:hypothetical protein
MLRAWPVGRRVDDPHCDSPECLRPAGLFAI